MIASAMKKKDLVGKALNDLLVNEKFDYITTGVPPHDLEARLAHAITVSSGETDFEKVQTKAKAMIAAELKNEALIKSPDGNYFHGPKKSNFDTSEAQEDEYEDDEDMDDDDDRVTECDKSQDDVDYTPPFANYTARNRGEGRVSARMKKSRYDSDEYVYPTILKNLNKRPSPVATPVKNKPPKRKPGRKPTKRLPPTVCSICRNPSTEEINVTCRSCPVKAHQACVDEDLKGVSSEEWACALCAPDSPANMKGRCRVCRTISSKDLGILVTCESCSSKFHKKCHVPPIESGKHWECSKCCSTQKKSPNKTAKSSLTYEGEDDKSKTGVLPESVMQGQVCLCCRKDFTLNPVDRLLCCACKMAFHSGCCRVRSVHNISRLGSRKHRWRCDTCKIVKPGERMRSELAKQRELNLSKSQVRSEGSASTQISAAGNNLMDVDEKFSETKPEGDRKDQVAWWQSRLRPIVVGKKQPPLGPIPDLSVPDISSWSSVDVQNYFDEYFLEKRIGLVFIDQDIDGKALKLMRKTDVTAVFEKAGFNLGIILDVMQHVKRLQLRVNDRRYIWADIF